MIHLFKRINKIFPVLIRPLSKNRSIENVKGKKKLIRTTNIVITNLVKFNNVLIPPCVLVLPPTYSCRDSVSTVVFRFEGKIADILMHVPFQARHTDSNALLASLVSTGYV